MREDTENKEDSTFTLNYTKYISVSYCCCYSSELLTSGKDKNRATEFVSLAQSIIYMQCHLNRSSMQLGYTQLRELKCSLETKLSSLSDQLIIELQE